jgi:choline dehydrogenase-like flavoprotein
VHPVDLQHRLRKTQNVFVVDGSVCPTALGVNPSETIYALAHRAVDFVAAAV